MITAHGTINFPTFMPVTTFGDKYPLDRMIQPYLKRTSQCLMVSHYYAQEMKKRPNIGSPDLIPALIQAGADSFDSSSYARLSVDTRKEVKTAGIHANLYAALNRIAELNKITHNKEDLEQKILNAKVIRATQSTKPN